MAKRKRRKYSDEFKIQAVKMVSEQGLSLTEVAEDLGVSANTISRWKREFR